MFPNVTQNVATAVFTLVRFLKIAQKVANNMGYFYYKFCRQEFSKIVQSGHTGHQSVDNGYQHNLPQMISFPL